VHPSDTALAGETVVKAGIGIIGRMGRFLVRMRPAGTVYAGYWEFPGGKCEPGELPEDAVARECREETGLSVVVGGLRSRTLHRYPHGLVELHFYDCTTQDRASDPAVETGFRWVAAKELASLRFPEANEAVVEELAEEAKSVRD
jgi:8-oxo-dGTP diphosphatase